VTQPNKPLKTLLVVSLLLNVFLVGGMAGGLYQWLGHNRAQPLAVAEPQRGLRQALVQLPDVSRRQLRQLLRQTRIDSQPLLLAGRQARLDVVERLQQPSLDRNALDADLSRAREADSALRARVETALADFAAGLSLEDRQKLADSLYVRGQGKGHPGNKH